MGISAGSVLSGNGGYMKILYTDYPFVELGDEPCKIAPIRKVMPISWDGDKYVKVLVDGIYSEIKAGYIYTKKGRCGDVPTFNADEYFNAMNDENISQPTHFRDY